jgi:hypothetical protein
VGHQQLELELQQEQQERQARQARQARQPRVKQSLIIPMDTHHM